MIKGILFDFDGVAVKSMEQHYEAWSKALADKGCSIEKEDFYMLEGQGVKEISNAIGRKFHLNQKDMNELVEKKTFYYNQIMKLEFYPYFFELLDVLKNKKLKLGVVTGGAKSRVADVVKNHFSEYFECLVTVDDVQHGKPYPDPFLKGAEILGLKSDECIVIENAPKGIEAAVKAGMTVIAVKTTLTEKYLDQAHFIVNDFRQVEQTILSLL
ncbi:MAG TPA: HAD family phosphatase [Caldithrix sp.]|nr:HAD family phosphatase [Calditrichaceae bacterium]HEM48867.1 HAD family phosphatase [Caldithrix sp.]